MKPLRESFLLKNTVHWPPDLYLVGGPRSLKLLHARQTKARGLSKKIKKQSQRLLTGPLSSLLLFSVSSPKKPSCVDFLTGFFINQWVSSAINQLHSVSPRCFSGFCHSTSILQTFSQFISRKILRIISRLTEK